MLRLYPAYSITAKTILNNQKVCSTEFDKYLKNVLYKTCENVLLSFSFHYNDNPKIRTKFHYSKNVLGDSGGFQLAQKEIYKDNFKTDTKFITPKNVLTWLEDNCDFGMNLDIPPIINKSNDNYESIFDNSLKVSNENFDYFQKNRNENSNLKLFNVLHGRNFDFIQKWFDMASKYEFEGWAIGVKPNYNPIFMILILLFLYDRLKNQGKNLENYYVHILGTDAYPLLFALAKFNSFCNIKYLSYDSSTYSTGSQYAQFQVPTGYQHERFLLDFHLKMDRETVTQIKNNTSYTSGNLILDDYIRNGLKMPCLCELCSSWNEFIDKNEKYVNDDLIFRFTGINCSHHNLLQRLTYTKFLNGLMLNQSFFNVYAKTLFKQNDTNFTETIKSFEIMEKYFIKGISINNLIKSYFPTIEQTISRIMNNDNFQTFDDSLFEE